MQGDASEAVKLGASSDGLDDATKVLGVSWIPSTDDFTFNFNPELSSKDVKTPRDLVSISSSLYDPLGLISPFALHGRKMLQRCDAQKSGWDSPLNPTLRQNFEKWAKSIPVLADLRLPRWWNQGIDAPKSQELHVFSDASATSGYGACAYNRVEAPNGDVKVILLCSRSHVVPLDSSRASHHNSTPRLELFACEKGVELRLFVQRSMETSFDRIVMWSDSESSLKMINDRSTHFRLFFANRLLKIHANSLPNEWRHVDSASNPADCNSRGIQANEKDKWDFFFF